MAKMRGYYSFLKKALAHPMTCGISVPEPVTEPVSSALEARSLNHWTRPLKTLTFILLVFSLHVLSLSFALTKAAATMVLLSGETHVPRS